MNRIKARWEQGASAVCGWLQIPGTLHAEALASLGFDGVIVDLQHSPIDVTKAGEMLLAIEHGGAEPMARLQSNDASDIMKLLDLGAYGIIAPMIETVEGARELTQSLRYPPDGIRSFGPRRPPLRYGTGYVAKSAETIVSMGMIETRKGLDNLEAILSVPGLDGIFIGPADLALALGAEPRPDSADPIVIEAVAHIREQCHAAGRRVGIFCGEGAFAAAKLDEGFDLVSVAPDLPTLVAQTRRQLEHVRAHV